MKTELIERQHYERHESGTLDFEAPEGPPVVTAPQDHSRGRDNPNSKAAFERAHTTASSMRDLILERVKLAGETGLTLKEFVKWFNGEISHRPQAFASLNGCSGRFSELKHAGQIEQSEERRDDCGVWRMKK